MKSLLTKDCEMAGEKEEHSFSPAYPYGTQLTFEDEVWDQLDLVDTPKVGDIYAMTAKVEVVSVTLKKDADGNNEKDEMTVNLQIVEADLKPTRSKSVESTIYGDE